MADYWGDRVKAKVQDSLQRNREAMRAVVSRPVLRRRPTRDLLHELLLDPAAYGESAREQLMQYLLDRYGESARMVAPYVVPHIETTAPPEEPTMEEGGTF